MGDIRFVIINATVRSDVTAPETGIITELEGVEMGDAFTRHGERLSIQGTVSRTTGVYPVCGDISFPSRTIRLTLPICTVGDVINLTAFWLAA
mgnify:FL=1